MPTAQFNCRYLVTDLIIIFENCLGSLISIQYFCQGGRERFSKWMTRSIISLKVLLHLIRLASELKEKFNS